MKLRLLLLSMLAMVAYWYWVRRPSGPSAWRASLRHASRSIAVGIAVYFVLLLIMLIYLLASGY